MGETAFFHLWWHLTDKTMNSRCYLQTKGSQHQNVCTCFVLKKNYILFPKQTKQSLKTTFCSLTIRCKVSHGTDSTIMLAILPLASLPPHSSAHSPYKNYHNASHGTYQLIWKNIICNLTDFFFKRKRKVSYDATTQKVHSKANIPHLYT